MTDDSSKRIDAFLQEGGLHSILVKLKTIEEISARVMPLLDDQIKYYCQVATVKDNTLILLTASSSMATMVHLRSSDLLKRFKQDPVLKSINHIQCKVRPASVKSQPVSEQPRKLPPPSSDTIETVASLAESIQDEDLKQSLQQIVNTWRSHPREGGDPSR